MFVKTLAEILNTDAHVSGETFESRRFLTAADGLGYSFHDTLVKAGTTQHMQYKNHVETNYCVGGSGEVENAATGQVWPLTPGTMYVLENHDPHIVRATTDMHMICIFTPALTGREKHDKDGSYEASE